MRWYFKVMIAVLLAFGVLELAGMAQQPGGGFGGFGGFGKGGQSDPIALLRNQQIKKELKITDEQSAKINEVLWKALGEVLDTDQLKRLKQIDLQQRDFRAFTDPAVQKELKMSEKQKDDVKTIIADAEKELADLTKDLKGGGGDFKGIFEKMQNINKDLKERVTGVLTAEQKRTWNEMIGEEFKFDFGKGKGKGKGGGGQ